MSIKEQIQLHFKCLLKDHKVIWHVKGIIRALQQTRKLNFKNELDHILNDNLKNIKKSLTNKRKVGKIEIETTNSITDKEIQEHINNSNY